MGDILRARNGDDLLILGEHPGNGELRQRAADRIGNLARAGDQLHILGEVRIVHAREEVRLAHVAVDEL